MAGGARQMETLAVLVSQHAVVTHHVVVDLQQEEQERRQAQLPTCCSHSYGRKSQDECY